MSKLTESIAVVVGIFTGCVIVHLIFRELDLAMMVAGGALWLGALGSTKDNPNDN